MKPTHLALAVVALVATSWSTIGKPPQAHEHLHADPIAAHREMPPHQTKAQVAKSPGAQIVVRKLNRWLSFYADLGPKKQGILENAATHLAKARRAKLKALMIADPEAALELALPAATRAKLPQPVTALLERRIDAFGEVIHIDCLREFDGQEFVYVEAEDTWLRVGEEEFLNPSVYGRRLSLRSQRNLPVHGIALDDVFAWSELPLRVLDLFEKQLYGYKQDTPVILIGDEPVPLQNPQLLPEIQDLLTNAEATFGPILPPLPELLEGDAEPYNRAYMTGIKRVLWLPVDFNEFPGSRFTRSPDTDYTIAQGDEWVRASSRERTSLDVTYFPGILRLPPDALEDFRRGRGLVVRQARAALEDFDRANGGTGAWLITAWDRVAIVVSDIEAADGSILRGAFSTGGPIMVFYGLIDRFFMHHELGHSYIFGHSDFFRPTTPDLSGPGIFFNSMNWDFMGQGFGDQRSHPNGLFKRNAYWFEDTEWIDATDGGRFALFAHDTAPPDIPRGLLVRTPDNREYWIDMRRLWPEETQLHNGVQIHFWEKREPTERFPVSVQATARRPSAVPRESPFLAGDVFEDTERGVRIIIRSVGMDPFRFRVYTATVDVERF